MLLRSSSTPALGSLLSPIQKGSNNSHETNTTFKQHLPPSPTTTTTIHRSQSYNKLSCAAFNIPTVSCNSSLRSTSVADHKVIRRAQSAGNLEGLAYPSCKDEGDFCSTNKPSSKKISGRKKGLVLESIPSFSYSNSRDRQEDDESDWEDNEGREEYLDENDEDMLQRNRIGGERVVAMEGGGFNLNNEIASMVLSEKMNIMEILWNVGCEGERGMIGQKMYLAKGLGIGDSRGWRGGFGGGGGGEFNSAGSGGNGQGSQGIEEYYKKMIEENPGNPLVLSNYAQFLYQSKQDLPKAEEYYSRTILADPGDGEILSQYAKLVWELHQDKDRAATYHEIAVHASPEDSHVHASYAGFLWETHRDDDECDAPSNFDSITTQIGRPVVASANAYL